MSDRMKFFKLVDWANEQPNEYVVAPDEESAYDQQINLADVQAIEIDHDEYYAAITSNEPRHG